MIASLPDVNSKAIHDGLLVSTIAPAENFVPVAHFGTPEPSPFTTRLY